MTMTKEALSLSTAARQAALCRPVEVVQILRDASQLSTRSWKAMLATAMVGSALCVLLFLGARFSTSPLMGLAMELYLLHAHRPGGARGVELAAAVERDARDATAKELIFLAISFLTSWISSAVAFYVHEAAAGREQPPAPPRGGLGGLRGPLTTIRCIAGLTLVYAFFLEGLVLVLLAAAGASVGFLVAGVMVASLARLLSFAMGMFWGQGLAISMLDDEGCCGMEALRRPVEILRGGWPAAPSHLQPEEDLTIPV
ncbi:hypothetical protein Taro_019831 [Colocasia esculenta]|uniref:Transmembrane protein n=1 Tax=Colocasia esculenta TaxID=4460 RepID=A0A843V0E2_COLES|nr:hypothetical protein [Colocasia esculenta]